MALGIDDTEYYLPVGWSPNYRSKSVPWEFTTTTDTDSFPGEIGTADPETCEHEWWEDTLTTYTTSPACFKQICKLCGSIKWRTEPLKALSPRWRKVVE